MIRISLSDAEAKLEELVSQAESGEVVILTEDGRDVAELVPFETGLSEPATVMPAKAGTQ
jgi:prevent-host-death family protein